MPPPSQTPASTVEERAGRTLAVIARTGTRAKGFIFGRSVATGEELFLHVSGVPGALWPMLTEGDPITCRVSDTSKGVRGFDVLRATKEEEIAIVVEEEERRGNR